MIKKLLILLLLCSTASAQFWNQKPMLGRRINRSHPNAHGLVGAWLRNEGSGNTVADLSGNGNHEIFGAGAASPSWIAGDLGTAVAFGVGDTSTISSANNFGIIDTTTIVVGVKFNSLSVDQRVLSDADDNFNNRIRHDSGPTRWEIHFDRGTANAVLYTHTPVLNQLYHIAFVNRAGFQGFYIDGIFKASTADNDALTNTDSNAYILGSNLNGSIEYLYLYNRALSASQIAQLYREPFGMFEPVFPVWWGGGIGAPPAGGGQVIFIN